MSRMKLILVASLFCCAIRAEEKDNECASHLTINPQILTSSGKVLLSSYTVSEKQLKEETCFKLECGGEAFPHRKIIWYRLFNTSNNESGQPVASYWRDKYYYDMTVTTNGAKEINSSLIITKFNKAYKGIYYCIITNNEQSVKSPMISISLYIDGVQGPQRDDPKQEQVLFVHNIKAVLINNSNLLVSWNASQRVDNDKFCKILQEGKERRKVFTWKLQILEWPNYAALAKNPSYDNIVTSKYFSLYEKVDNRMLSRQQCKNMRYLLTDVSLSGYYKFQIVVARHSRRNNYNGTRLADSGSFIYHFGTLTRPKISYPTHLEKVCKPYDANICKVTGNPPPRVHIYHPVKTNDTYTCIADNVHLHGSGEVLKFRDIIEFYWDKESCTPTEAPSSPPQPSCARPSSDSVCGKIISQNSKVYVHRGLDINTLEKRAHDSINQLKNDSGYCYNQMVKVICYSFLAPCYMDAAKPTSVCPESCQAIITAQCHSGTFNNVLVNLPEWSPSRNCLKSEAISNEECIHLSVPSVERKNFTDGPCVVGRGSQCTGNSSSTGCISWDDPRQIFFDTRVFTELKSAGASCCNPSGSRERPWCYVNLTFGSLENWKYCDAPKCPVPILTISESEQLDVVGEQTYRVNEDGNITCTATGYPVPDVVWLNNDRSAVDKNRLITTNPVPTGIGGLFNVSIILMIKSTDYGMYMYMCYANNSLGTKVSIISVMWNNDENSDSNSYAVIGGAVGVILMIIAILYMCISILYMRRTHRKKPLHIYDTVTYTKTTSVNSQQGPIYDTIKDKNMDYSIEEDSDSIILSTICAEPTLSCSGTGEEPVQSNEFIHHSDLEEMEDRVTTFNVGFEAKSQQLSQQYNPCCMHDNSPQLHHNTVTGNVKEDDMQIDSTVDQSHTTNMVHFLTDNVATSTDIGEEEHDRLPNDNLKFDVNVDQTCSAQKSCLSLFPIITNSIEPTDEGKYGIINQPKCDDFDIDAVIDQNYATKTHLPPKTNSTKPGSESNYGVINQPKHDDFDIDTVVNENHTAKTHLSPITNSTKPGGESNYGVINQPKHDDFDIDTVVDNGVIYQPKCDDCNIDTTVAYQSHLTKIPITNGTKFASENNYGVIHQPKHDDFDIDAVVDYGVINQPKCDDPDLDSAIDKKHITIIS